MSTVVFADEREASAKYFFMLLFFLNKKELILAVDALYFSFWTLLVKVSLEKPPFNAFLAGRTLCVFIRAVILVFL